MDSQEVEVSASRDVGKDVKLWIMSDLHIDVLPDKYGFRLPDPRPKHDVVVIAGDIRENAVKSVKYIANACLNDKPVIFVRGNHESYGRAIDTDLVKAKEEAARHANIHVLENETVEIGDTKFIGATLWTDYLLYGEAFRWACVHTANSTMNDHRKIRVAADGYRKFSTKHAAKAHEESRQYIAAVLSEERKGPRVVVTHHAPSIKSVDHDRFGGDLLNAAYASNLEQLVDKADLWVHGHMHHRSDYRVGNGRVVCNPRGYAYRMEQTAFDPSLVIDVPTNQTEAIAA